MRWDLNELFGVAGKAIVITGAGSGIGRVLAAAFTDLGARVVGADILPAEAMPEGVVHYPVDLAKPASIGGLGVFVEETLGGIDVLINNAARTEHGRIEALSLEEWRRTIDVNLTGTFLVAQALGRVMIARGHGKIINLASRCGFVGIPFNAAYNASKAGIMSLTQTLAVEWAARNVQVNAIVPGFVRTPMTAREGSNPAVLDLFARKIPLRRVSEPTDLVGAAVFLASPASDYMTGAALFVDGGNYASGGIGAEAAAQGPSGE